MTVLSNQPLTIRGVWRASWQLYRKIFSQVWFLAAILGVLSSAVLLYSFPFDTKLGIKAMIYSVYVPALIVSLFSTYLNSVVLHRAYIVDGEQSVTLGSSLSFVAKKYCRIIVSSFFGTLLLLPGLLLVLPGFYMAIAFFLLKPLILFDDNSIFAALKNSLKLVWGNWWRVVAIITPLWCLLAVGGTVLQQISVRTGMFYVLVVGNALVMGMLYSLMLVCVFVLYNDLKLRLMNKQCAAM